MFTLGTQLWPDALPVPLAAVAGALPGAAEEEQEEEMGILVGRRWDKVRRQLGQRGSAPTEAQPCSFLEELDRGRVLGLQMGAYSQHLLGSPVQRRLGLCRPHVPHTIRTAPDALLSHQTKLTRPWTTPVTEDVLLWGSDPSSISTA